MEIYFKSSLTSSAEWSSFFKEVLTSDTPEIIGIECPLLTKEESLNNNFWKDFICGVDEESPFAFIKVATTPEFRENYIKEDSLSFEFQVVIDIVKFIYNLKEENLGIEGNGSLIGNIEYKKFYLEEGFTGSKEVPVGGENSEDPEEPNIEKAQDRIQDRIPDILSFLNTDTSKLITLPLMVAIPRKISIPSDWNKMSSLMKSNYIKYRLKKVFA